jgi:hypothetical protein
MLKNKLLLKIVAVFIVIEMSVSTVLPTVALALTSGPTAPEATSFEPVDTSDLVNVMTGDLTYNVPLLNVDGPSGGYPLALSYHAAIQPDEDASWVGLGWSLNPGAITRNVNGFADDQYNSNTTNRIYWEGGVQRNYELGVSIGLKGTASVGVGLAYSHDTYRGSLGVGFNVHAGTAAFSAEIGVSPDGSASVGAYVGSGSEKAGSSIGISTDLESVTVSAKTWNSGGSGNISVTGSSRNVEVNGGATGGAMGVQMSSSGRSTLKLGGFSGSVFNSKQGKISTNSQSYGVTIPIYAVQISLGYSYTRYWMDETEKATVNGSLYNPTDMVTGFDTKAYDSYTISSSNSSAAVEDPNYSQAFTFPDYDSYTVAAQGVGGSMRPYHYKTTALRQNRKVDGNYQIKQYPFADDDFLDQQVHFRFVNDFSNKYLTQNGTWTGTASRLDASFGDALTGETNSDGIVDNQLAGSKHIEWYTNAQILGTDATKLPFSKGFVDATSTGFDRSTAPPSQIGGFKITNESGVTYHFALPAYAYDEYQYSENIRRQDGKTFNELKKPEKYAYTWYLTAITGPDYVDRSTTGTANHVLDENDWGYWVSFEYGQWTDNYAWRNPGNGYIDDIDNNFRNYASGKKELYYLDAIKTKTNTAIFIKEMRIDGKSSAVAYNLQKKSDFGYIPSTYSGQFTSTVYAPDDCGTSAVVPRDKTITNLSVTHTTYPVSPLKLKKTLLFDNLVLKNILQTNNIPSLNDLKSTGLLYSFNINFNKQIQTTSTVHSCPNPNDDPCECEYTETTTTQSQTVPATIFLHKPSNIFDTDDFRNIASSLRNATKVIEFETDYSLTPETDNSFDHPNLYSATPPTSSTSCTYYGKLTLKGLHFSGRGSADPDLIPPMRFAYDYPDPVKGFASITTDLGNNLFNMKMSVSKLQAGDLINFSAGSNCFAMVESINGTDHTLRILGRNRPALGNVVWTATKNPPYNKDHYDIWGLYKPDYADPNGRAINRYTTPNSVKSLDAWSLREVTTSVGAKISFDYGPDTYARTVMQNGSSFVLNFVTPLGLLDPNDQTPPFTFRYMLNVRNEGKDLSTIYTVDSFIEAALPYSYSLDGITREIKVLTVGKVAAVTANTLEVHFTDYILNNQQSSTGVDYYGGVIFYNTDQSQAPHVNAGGGLRVNSITLTDPIFNKAKKVTYDYNKAGLTSGATSYEPNIVEKFTSIGDSQVEKYFKLALFSRFDNILLNAREVPAPGIMYEQVTVKEEILTATGFIPGPTYNQYNFEPLRSNMVGLWTAESTTSGGDTYDGITYGNTFKARNVIKDFTTWSGRLNSVVSFDRFGNKVSELRNEYLHQQIANYTTTATSLMDQSYRPLMDPFNQQGVIQESAWSGKFVKIGSTFRLYGTISEKHSYPSVEIAQTSINYKTGVSTRTENRAFDFYSGVTTKTRGQDQYGHTIETEILPAYREYDAMGLMISGGKNMLTQQAGAISKQTDPTGATGLLSASVQTWSDNTSVVGAPTAKQPGFWRKEAAYAWSGNDRPLENSGLYAYSSFNRFNFDDLSANSAQWEKISAVTLYDVASHPLEAIDINGDKAATKTSSDQTRIFATIAGARYDEFAFSGAEDNTVGGAYGGGVLKSDGTEQFKTSATDKTTTHTGAKSVRLSSTSGKTFMYSFTADANSDYLASIWVNSMSGRLYYSVNGVVTSTPGTPSENAKAGSWYLINAKIPKSASMANIAVWASTAGGACNFDDFRVGPYESPLISYVYNEWGDLSHILNSNNLYTEYIYDDLGRLKEVKKETLEHGVVKTAEHKYNYGLNN